MWSLAICMRRAKLSHNSYDRYLQGFDRWTCFGELGALDLRATPESRVQQPEQYCEVVCGYCHDEPLADALETTIHCLAMPTMVIEEICCE